MKLTVLGSGTFFVTKDQTASAFLLETDTRKILVDCGPGTLVRLSENGIKPEDLDYVFLTHFHPDHSSDLFTLFMNIRLHDLFSPGYLKKYPTFFGPPGIKNFFIEYSHLCQLPSLDGYGPYDKIKFVDFNNKIRLDDFSFKSFQVDHNAFKCSALAYSIRFEIKGKTIVFSGDSALCQGLKDSCQNADVFVCDCSYPKGKSHVSHLDAGEIGQISQSGQVKKILLTHFYPQYSDCDFVTEVKENFSGDVVKCHDGLTLEI